MKRFLSVLVLLSILPVTVMAGDASGKAATGDKSKSRPKVGLVLAGGGAKGAAHIGAIKYIEELGIPIDYVAGTSMGSIIGGLYSLGYTPDEMDEIIKSVDWSQIMGNSTERNNASYSTKARKDSYLFSFPFGTRKNDSEGNFRKIENYIEDLSQKGELINTETSPFLLNTLPSGFILGNNVENLFNDLSIGYQDSIDFRDLPIPYACVTTNMLDGSEAVLKSGRIADAMRSSMAIPIVFAPMKYDDMLLVDGGMVNNFPTDICREMGADIIIGIELSKGFKVDMSDVESMPGMLGQLMAIVTSGHNAENRKLCDAYLRPDVSGYGTLSFDDESIDSLVARGYEEAKRCTDELLAIKEKLEAFGPVEEKNIAGKAQFLNKIDTMVLSSITFNGLSGYDGKWMSKKWGIEAGKKITPDEIHRKISRYQGTGSYEKVSYNTIPDPNNPGMYRLDLYFKEHEPHRFSIGLRGDTEEAVVLGFNLGYNENKLSGFSASLGGRLSFYPFIQAKATYAWQGMFKVNLSYDFWRSKYHYIFDEEAYRSASGNDHRNRVRLYLSEYNSRFIHVEGGVEYEKFDYDGEIVEGMVFQIDSNNRNAGLFLDFNYDNRNDSYYAVKGLKVNLGGKYRFFAERTVPFPIETFSTKSDNAEIYGSIEAYFTPGGGPVTIIPQLYHRVVFGDYSGVSVRNAFGGSKAGRFFEQQIPFIGINGVYTSDYHSVSVARCDLRWNFLSKHYLTGIVNYLESAESIRDYLNREVVEYGYMRSYGYLGAALKYTYASKIGPMSLDVHWSNLSKKVGLYLSIGYDF